MDKINLQIVLLLFTILSSSIEFLSASPLTDSKINTKLNTTQAQSNLTHIKSTELKSTELKSTELKSAKIKAIQINNTILSINVLNGTILSVKVLNGTSKVNLKHNQRFKTNSTHIEAPTGRTFQLLQFNSWLVGAVMGGLQSIFGKTFIPDSHVIFLQTIVNPTLPFQYANQWWNQEAESSNRIDEIAKSEQQDFVLNELLEILKPKIIEGLTNLADPEVFTKLNPRVNLTIHPTINLTIHNPNSMRPQNSPKLNEEIVYNLVDFDEYNKNPDPKDNYDDSELHEDFDNYETYEISYPDLIANLLKKKQINSTNEEESVTNLNDVLLNSSLIHNLESQEQTTDRSTIHEQKLDNSNQQTISVVDEPEFREMQSVSSKEQFNQTDESNVNRVNEDLKTTEQSIKKLNLADKTEYKLVESNEIFEKPIQSDKQGQSNVPEKEDKKNRIELNNDKLNLTEHSDEFDKTEPILNLVICDDKNECKEEQIEEWNKQSENETDYKEPNKELIQITKKSGIKKFLDQVIVNPMISIKNSMIYISNAITRDIHLILKMIRSLFGFTWTCKYKFLCQFSSFLSLHTPDFIKSHFQRKAENYYVNIVEEANSNEFLNALVTGYIGFDCSDFYVDKRCP